MTGRSVPIIGLRFGRLSVLAVAAVSGKRGMYLVKCDCGVEKAVYGGHLRFGSTTSCGCGHKGVNATHKMSGTSEYKAWDNARDRCKNPSNRKYPLYGGRGINVCARWSKSFDNFIADMGRKPSAAHSLDRKDSDGNYEPGNCRWATVSEQNNNRSFNRHVMLGGERLTIAQAARQTGIPHATILSRLDAGKSDTEALRNA